MSDYKGAALMIDALPRARAMRGDRGYDADWFRFRLNRQILGVALRHDRTECKRCPGMT
jgi:hypothetical protein